MISKQKIQHLRSMLDAAYGTPWIAEIKNRKWTGAFLCKNGIWSMNLRAKGLEIANAECAAIAVSVLPDLLQEIERLNREVFTIEFKLEQALIAQREDIKNCLKDS
jgi:hypothetical protein